MSLQQTVKIIVFFIPCILLAAGNSGEPKLLPKDTIAEKIDQYIQACVALNRFNGAILIAKGNEILLSKGYGFANHEHVIPNTPQTKFRLASVSKQFTALAIMQLQERGLLSVQDPLCNHLPDFPNGDRITIHHLLTHMSGLQNFTTFSEYQTQKKELITLEKIIETFKNKPLDFEPGSQHKYCNSGYVLLSYLIEKISGLSYEQFLQENIFRPLGMNNSGYDHNNKILQNRATGYSLDFDDGELVHAEYIDMTQTGGAGGLYSTIDDMFRWNCALHNSKLISKDSLQKMITPFKDSFYGYGYGLIIEIEPQLGNRTLIWHNGGIEGFRSFNAYFPEEDIIVIILSNFEPVCPDRLFYKGLGPILFNFPYEMPTKRESIIIDFAIYDAYVGQYESEKVKGFIVTITKENNKLIFHVTGQFTTEILPETSTEFFLKFYDEDTVSFIKDEQGTVIELVFDGLRMKKVS